jgi:spoIIIJ-associated protein
MNERSRDAKPSEDESGESAQYTGKSVEEAVAKASEALGIPPTELDYEVVRDSSHSILGLVRKGEAVIRVWLPTALGDLSDERSEQDVEGAEEPASPESAAETTEHKAEQRPAAKPVASVLSGMARELEEEEATPEGALLKGNPPELEQVATEVLATLIDKMGMIAAVEVVDEGGKLDASSNEISPMVMNAVGDDLGLLIGRRGETLRDLQFIARLIISRKLGVWPNVIVDVEGYKAKRVTSLQALAKRLADEVRQTHHMVVLEPMPAYERRIIHLTLREDPDVYTESTGEDEERKVQILPR